MSDIDSLQVNNKGGCTISWNGGDTSVIRNCWNLAKLVAGWTDVAEGPIQFFCFDLFIQSYKYDMLMLTSICVSNVLGMLLQVK